MLSFYRKNKKYVPAPIFEVVMRVLSKIGAIDWFSRHQVRAFYDKNSKLLFKPGCIVFDIGANHGDYSEIFYSHGVKVVAVEPHPVLAEQLKCRGFVVVNMGVSDNQGEGELFIGKGSDDGVSTFVKDNTVSIDPSWPRHFEEHPVKVGMTTLDCLITQHGVPHYCKIDVEGYEPLVLRGLRQKVPFLSFEAQTPRMGKIDECLAEILKLCPEARFNYTDYLSGDFCMKWGDAKELKEALAKEAERRPWGGDVFVRMIW